MRIARYYVLTFVLLLAHAALGESTEDRIQRLGPSTVADELFQCGGFFVALTYYMPEMVDSEESKRMTKGYLNTGHYVLTNFGGVSDDVARQRSKERMMAVANSFLELEEADVHQFMDEQSANCDIHSGVVMTSLGEKAVRWSKEDGSPETQNENVRLVESGHGLFRVLNLVNIQVPPSVAEYWHTEDVEESGSKGTLFTGVDSDQTWVLNFQVMDVSGDESEPDISLISEEAVEQVDSYLNEMTEKGLGQAGISLTEWMSSTLNQPAKFPGAKYLVSVYRMQSGESENIAISIRASIGGRKAVLIGTTNADDQDAVGAIASTLAVAVIEAQLNGLSGD